ncbi:hypothetical protein Tco_0243285 [Tanacetum coccineum]
MGCSSSQPHMKQPMSPIHSFSTEDMYSPQYSNSFQYTASFQHTACENSAVEVAAPLQKSKPTRGRQKRTAQKEDAPRSTAWTNEEEIKLCKGWVHVFKNSSVGNARRESGFWIEALRYLENKTKASCRRTRVVPETNAMIRLDYEAEHEMTLHFVIVGRSSSFNTESRDASINLNADVCDDDEDEVHELRQ